MRMKQNCMQRNMALCLEDLGFRCRQQLKKKFIKVNNKQKNITKIFRSQKSIAIPMLLGRESSCINSQC